LARAYLRGLRLSSIRPGKPVARTYIETFRCRFGIIGACTDRDRGVALLANKSYPVDARVTTAFNIPTPLVAASKIANEHTCQASGTHESVRSNGPQKQRISSAELSRKWGSVTED